MNSTLPLYFKVSPELWKQLQELPVLEKTDEQKWLERASGLPSIGRFVGAHVVLCDDLVGLSFLPVYRTETPE